MRHAKKRHRLGRTASHRKATLQALSSALIRHKRITTTETKAKALRVFIEPIITRAKEDSMHNRREVFRRLQDKAAVTGLFEEVAEAVGDRPGGYTRVIKLGKRSGDAAEMAVIELVDFNDVKPAGDSSGRKRTRRGGSGGRRRSRAKAEPATSVDVAEEEETVQEQETAQEDAVPEEASSEAGAEDVAVEEAQDESVEEHEADSEGEGVETQDAAPLAEAEVEEDQGDAEEEPEEEPEDNGREKE